MTGGRAFRFFDSDAMTQDTPIFIYSVKISQKIRQEVQKNG